VIGAGFHEHVAVATRRLVHVVEEHLELIPPTADTGLPPAGSWTFHAVTTTGHHAVTVAEDDLQSQRSPLWTVFAATHDVLTELRILDEQREPESQQ
jgi:hypothetical protein